MDSLSINVYSQCIHFFFSVQCLANGMAVISQALKTVSRDIRPSNDVAQPIDSHLAAHAQIAISFRPQHSAAISDCSSIFHLWSVILNFLSC